MQSEETAAIAPRVQRLLTMNSCFRASRPFTDASLRFLGALNVNIVVFQTKLVPSHAHGLHALQVRAVAPTGQA